jgi:iron complex transport system permease protein
MATAIPVRRTRTPATAPLHTGRRRAFGLAAAVVALLGCMAASLAIGSLSLPLREVVEAFTAHDGSDAHVIVTELRVPRTILGFLVGGALGACGVLMQGVTRNPLADPSILGINAGAALAVVCAISLLGVDSVGGYVGFAIAGAAITAVLIYLLGASGRGGVTPITLAIAGAVLAALLVSITSAILVFDAQTLDQFRFWLVGSIAGRGSGVALTVLPFIAVGMLVALAAGRQLNAMALGDDVAHALGQRVARARVACAVAIVLLAGGAVAAAGPIVFVGLTVPHIARALVGPDYRWVVPYSIVLGAVLLLAADVIGRVVTRPGELEVGIVTAVLGAPFFIWLVRRRNLTTL